MKPKARRVYTSEDLAVDTMTTLAVMLDLRNRANLLGVHEWRDTPGHLLEYQALVLRAEDIRAAHATVNKSMLSLLEEGG